MMRHALRDRVAMIPALRLAGGPSAPHPLRQECQAKRVAMFRCCEKCEWSRSCRVSDPVCFQSPFRREEDGDPRSW